MPSWGSGLAHALTAGATGYSQGQEDHIKDLVRFAALQRQKAQAEDAHALHAATMRKAGYIPVGEQVAGATTPSPSAQSVDQIMSDAMAGVNSPASGATDVKTQRYGQPGGGFVYDAESPAAQMARARVGEASALESLRTEQAARAHAALPSAALRQSLIDAGNTPEDVDAALATGDRVAIRNLLRADPTETHKANRQYDINHPLPSRATTRTAGTETAAHRDARQGLAAVRGQLTDTERQLHTMDRSAPPLVQYPGIASGTAADSSAARQFTQRRGALETRADSLRGVSDRLAAQMTGGVPNPARGSSNAQLPPLTAAQRQRAVANPDYRQFLVEKGYTF